ncbi:hypothetical protein SMG44B_30363 [Stenotrophomonas maltophilia]
MVGGQATDGPGYTGHVSDSVTGLSYMQQRWIHSWGFSYRWTR